SRSALQPRHELRRPQEDPGTPGHERGRKQFLSRTSASARARTAGAAAAALWLRLGLRWFDIAAGWRPAWRERVPTLVLAVVVLVLAGFWLAGRWRELWGPPPGGPRRALLLVVGVAVLFRLPLAGQGAAGYVTPDGALSGIVALHLRDGTEHLVFVPHVPYSGGLKSHVTAPLAVAIDPARGCRVVAPRRALRAVPPAALGFVLGDWPGLLWNAANGWESFLYLLPGRVGGGAPAGGPGLGSRAWGLITDQSLVLLGYDPGYSAPIDFALKVVAVLAAVVAAVAIIAAARDAWRRRSAGLGLLLCFTAVNVLMALVALPQIEGNPR